MAKSFILPDGRVIEGINDKYSEDEIREKVMRKFPELYQREIEEQKGFIPSLKRGAKEAYSQLLPEFTGGIKALAGMEPEEEKPEAPLIQPKTFEELRNQPSWGGIKQYLGEQVGRMGVQAGVPLAVAGTAAIGGAPAAVGAGLAGLSMLPGIAHGVYQRGLQQGKSPEEATAAARLASIPEAALYSLPVGRIIGGAFGKKAISQLSDAELKVLSEQPWWKDKLKSIATETPIAAAVGAGTEGITQAALGENYDPNRMVESAVPMGLLGALAGGLGGTRAAARGERGERLQKFESGYPAEISRLGQERLKQDQINAQNELAGYDIDERARQEQLAKEEAERKKKNANLLGGHTPFGYDSGFSLEEGTRGTPLDRTGEGLGTAALSTEQNIFAPVGKSPSNAFIQHDQGLETIPSHQNVTPIKPVFAEDVPVNRTKERQNILTSTLHDAYVETRGEKPGVHSYTYYIGQLKGANTPEAVHARIDDLIAKTKDQAKQETLAKWKENLEAKGWKGAENAAEPRIRGNEGKQPPENVAGRSEPSVGVSASKEGSTAASKKTDAGRLEESGGTAGERNVREGTVEPALKARPLHEADYDPANVTGTIKASQEFLAQEEAKRKPSGEKFKEEEKTLTPEEQEADNQDKAKIAAVTTDRGNPLGKYIRDAGGVDQAFEEIAFHRTWGMNEGKKEMNAKGTGWSKGEGQLSKPYKEISPHTARNAEKWINENLSDRGKEKYRKALDKEKNLQSTFLKQASHGPSEREGKKRGPYKIFKEDTENVRQMTRVLRGRMGEVDDIVKRAGNLIHAGDEEGARKRIEDWVEKNKSLVPDLRKFLGLKGKESLVEELLDRGIESNRVEHVFEGGGVPLSPLNERLIRLGRLNDVLKNLGEHSYQFVNRSIARRFAELAPNTTVRVVDFDTLTDGRYGNVNQGSHGAYLPEHNEILLNSNPRFNGLNEHTVLHEVAHALTNTIMKAVDDGDLRHLTATQQKAYWALKNLYNTLKQRKQHEGYRYGFDNLKEFVAEAFSNVDFQNFLQKQPISSKAEGFGAALKSLWDKFVHEIARMVGLENALTRTLSLSNILLAKPHPAWFDRTQVEHHFDSLLEGEKAPQERGFFETGVRKTEEARKTPMSSMAAAWHDAMIWLERTGFNQRYGITRFMPGSTFLKDGTLNPAALIQRMEYATQLAGTSLTTGYVDFTEKGMPIVKRDEENNIGTLMQAMQSLPASLGDDKVHAFNRITSNLTYAERLDKAKIADENARKVIDQANEKIKNAKGMSGPAAYQTIRKAKIAKKQAAKLLKKLQYERPDYITDESMAQAKEAANLPEVSKMLDIVRNMNMHDIDFYEKTGMISNDVANDWRQNKYYVNLGRVMDDVEQSVVMRGAGRIVNLRTLREFTGSDRPIDDVLGNIIRQRLFMTDAGIRNQASVAAIKYLQNAGEAGLQKIVGKPIEKQNVIQVWEDGHRTYYTVEDKHAFKSFQGLQEQAPAWMNAVEGVTALFREAITLSPDFIARNMFRDSTEAWAFGYTHDNLLKTWAKVAGQFAKSMPDISKEITKGGVHVPNHEVVYFGLTGSREMTSLVREKEAMLRKALTAEFGASPAKDWAEKADRSLKVVHHLLQNLTGESELATRERVFQDIKKRTGSVEEGIMAATNVLDWRMRGSGSAITYAKKLIPFFNSNLQGWYKIYRALARNEAPGGPEEARKMLAGKMLGMAAASTAYAMIMSNDKDYQQVKKQTADNAWLIPAGDHTFLKLPIPFEIGVVAKTLPENLIRLMNGDQSGRQMINDMGQALFNQLPGLQPQATKPLYEVLSNHDFYTGKPIESDTQLRKEGAQRFTEGTSETAKALGSNALSPLMVDHLLRGYFGSVGTFLTTAVLDPVLEKDGVGEKPTKPFVERPGVRAFLTNPTQSRTTDLLYELRDLTSKPKATYDAMIQEGRIKEAEEYAKAESPTGKTNAEMMALSPLVAGLTKQLSTMRAEQKRITDDEHLSDDEKAARIKDIKMKVREITEEVMKTLQTASAM